jgi:hypothetical protein
MAANNRKHMAADERKAIAKAIAWIENRVGRQTGTWQDRAAIDFSPASDPFTNGLRRRGNRYNKLPLRARGPWPPKASRDSEAHGQRRREPLDALLCHHSRPGLWTALGRR